MKVKISQEVQEVITRLQGAGFLAYLVGGCVRDMLIEKEPKDWDVTTDATPDQIQELFPDSVYENEFGTVGIKIKSKKEKGKNEEVQIVEVTTFRKEIGYSDQRHPDKIVFAHTIEEDLSRRDFTINAIAVEMQGSKIPCLPAGRKNKNENSKFKIVDSFGGQEDLKKKIIRAVGDPQERFSEDALRMMRAVRFACQLGFEIEEKTASAIVKNSKRITHIAWERIRDEFEKIILTSRAKEGVEMLYEFGLLNHIAPELVEGVGVEQNLHHIYTVWEHNVRALEYAAKKGYSLEVRLAALFHDVGKPQSKRGEGRNATFHGHEVISARMTKQFLERLRFSRQVIDDVTHLVRRHQFYYNTGEISEAGVRRFIKRVGMEYIDELLKVREADRIGSGVPKAFPYKLRHLQFMIDKVRRDPISPKMLAVNGNDIMNVAGLSPSPKVGMIQNALLEEVLDSPDCNTKEYLEKRIKELAQYSEDQLQKKAKESKKKQEVLEGEAEGELKKKYWVE